jgi:hypothetical protein
MVRPQLRRAIAAFSLTSILSLIPLGDASAAARPHGEHGRSPRTEVREKNRRFGLQDLFVLFLEKMAVKMDPNGLTTYPDPTDPH